MRRQASVGENTGASRTMRLDPFQLPVRYSAESAGTAQDAAISVLIDRDKVVLDRHRSNGQPATTSVPVNAYRGVAVRMIPIDDEDRILATIELMHSDPALSLQLMVAETLDDIAADWQNWSKILGLPLLLVEADGSITEPMPQLGRVLARGPAPRRRGSGTIKHRPRFLTRRKTGARPALEVLDNREIIARN